MRAIYATALLVVAIATAAAAPPTLELPKEVTGDPGSFIQVAAKTEGKHVSWRAVDPGLNLFPVELLKDSKVAIVTAPKAGRYRLIAITASGDELSTFAETMVVVGNAPQPPPVPPGPLPDGKFGLRKISRESCPINSAGWDRLANSIRSHASAVAAGGAGLNKSGQFDPSVALAELGAKNVAALSAAELKVWESWDKAVMQAFFAVYKAGLLKGKADWTEALNEIADGLEDI